MAQEAIVTVSLSFTKGTIPAQTVTFNAVKLDVAGSRYMRNVQTIGTSAEAILLGDVGTPGLAVLHNADATNYVEILDSVAGAVCLKIKAGEAVLFRFGSAAPAAKANTASVDLEYLVLPD